MKDRRLTVCLVATLLVACSAQEQSGRVSNNRAPTIDERLQPGQAQRAIVLDRQQPGSENKMPALEGAGGRLSYRPGCLLLSGENGEEVGLVIPSYVVFDGKRMAGKLKKPTGEPIITVLGEFVSLRGILIDNPRGGSYRCDTDRLLIADHF